jgi:hypothetical protein
MEIQEEKNLRILTASDGKTIVRKDTGKIVGKKLYLGIIDSPDNYEEADEPTAEEEQLVIS